MSKEALNNNDNRTTHIDLMNHIKSIVYFYWLICLING